MCQHRSGVLYSLLVIALSLVAVACSSPTGSSPSTMGRPDSGTGTGTDSGTPDEDSGVVIIQDAGTDDAEGTEGGGHYVAVDAGPQCGDGLINQPGEECDDGNRLAADGCSGACQVEPFFTCPTEGQPCVPSMVCGDSQVTAIEECDDGNAVGGDGCSSRCFIEASYYDCSIPGQPCVSTVTCGDGRIEGGEVCDDGNVNPGDGCSASCTIEPGWTCRQAGAHCTPDCGDGAIMAGAEECDDGNSVSGDGCSVSCRIEPGYLCSGSPSVCSSTTCGDGVQEGAELCDLDGDNGLFYGDGLGCSRTCTPEPMCRPAGGGPTGACTTYCGDGMIVGSETCDDGNTLDGDGCSSACAVEAGFTCDPLAQSDAVPCTSGGGNCLQLPIIFRDFKGAQETGGHPDFFYMGANGVYCVPDASGTGEGDSTARCTGLVNSNLGNDGKPVFSGNGSCPCQFTDWDDTGVLNGYTGTLTYNSDGHPIINTTVNVITSAATFDQWYHDVPGTNVTVRDTIELSAVGGQYQFSSSNGQTVLDDVHAHRQLTSGFFPLESQPETKICNLWPYWVSWSGCVGDQWDPVAEEFVTSTGVLRNFYFTSEVRYLFLFDATTNATLSFFGDDDVWVFVNGILAVDLGATHQRLEDSVTISSATASQFGLSPGNIYEIAVFHADRHPRDSNYQLTLSGFETTRSDCHPTCGDGVATLMEECDLGTSGNTGEYGGCNADCTFADFCGDAIVNGPEICDDGSNTTVGYGQVGCGPGCVAPPFCGDGVINGPEECDNGNNNQDDLEGGCSRSCTINPSCGDGVVMPERGEECDLGADNEPPESVQYGGCTTQCLLGPHCGDNIVQNPPEGCDDGNNEDFDGCSSICVEEMLVE